MSDDELVRRARAGDIDAFASLVSRYQDCVYAFVRSRVEDAPAAEDVAQEVFIAAHRALAKVADATGVLPWLLGIARFKLLDHRRAVRKRPPSAIGVELDDVPARPPPEEADALIESLFEGLPDEARAIALLRWGEGLSYREIARRLRMPDGTVATILHRTRRVLQGNQERLLGVQK